MTETTTSRTHKVRNIILAVLAGLAVLIAIAVAVAPSGSKPASQTAPQASTSQPASPAPATLDARGILARDGYSTTMDFSAGEFADLAGSDEMTEYIGGAMAGADYDHGRIEMVLILTPDGASLLRTRMGWDSFIQGLGPDYQAHLEGNFLVVTGTIPAAS